MRTYTLWDPQDREYLSQETVHYLRNLLLPVTGHTSLLLDDPLMPEAAKDGLRDVSEAAEQMLLVINQIDQKSRS
ncbi:MAG: hypothetical protein CMP86_01390 [Gammaproteobacteria bacterium]|jgi:signal transduction histidine kinase|nr:hypothetical protein [Gammaproteobacteria bacterium]